MAGFSFNAEEVEPEGNSFELLPVGDYIVVIEESDVRFTKKGDGKYLSLKLQIIDGKQKGRLLWENLNIENPNETAQTIGQGRLSAICRAVNVLNFADTVELHNLPLKVSVDVKMDSYKGENVNVIKGFKPAANVQQPGQPAPQQTAPTSEEPPPWMQGG